MAADGRFVVFIQMYLSFWLLLSARGLDAAAIVPRIDLKALLTNSNQTWAKTTTFSFPESSAFVAATERWSIFDPPTYSAAVSPGTEEDVVNTVKLAASWKTPFLATGGRHGYGTTLVELHDGLAIDLSQLNSVDIDKGAETVTVGPGAIVNDIFDPLYEAGFILQTGAAWCPSVIGVTIGGGIGRFQGIYGLMIDALVSVRIVTAEGEIVEASEESNSDFFWGIRGAAANFGIITSATYKVHRLLNSGQIYTVDFTFPANLSSQFFKTVSAMGPTLSEKLAGNAFINYDSNKDQAYVASNFMYYGPQEEGRAAMKPFFDIGGKTVEYYVPWNKLINTTFGGAISQICIPGSIHNTYSANIRDFDPRTYDRSFDKMQNFYAKYPGGRLSAVQFDIYPSQAMSSVPENKTAWPFRNVRGFISAAMAWSPGDEYTAQAASALGREIRDDVAATSGYSGLAVFVNYARGDEMLEQIYTEQKLPRLARLKKKWDPDHLFSFNHGLPSQYP